MAMEFAGKGSPLTQDSLDAAAGIADIDMPAMWSVLSVESKGLGYQDDRRPKILFERHIFHKRTGGKHSAQDPDISRADAGGYGSGGAHQYDRLARAIAFDRDAALNSASWGLGQVMGFNAGISGYGDVETFVTDMIASEEKQLIAMFRFIEHNGLTKHLKNRDWAGFARGYNGPRYAENAYDTKLAKNYASYSNGGLPDIKVRSAQVALTYLGFRPGDVDGLHGNATALALRAFQKSRALAETGRLDDETYDRLMSAEFPG